MTAIKPSERAWANIALIVTLATVLVAVVRVYAWSGFYVPVALSVLSVADRTTLLASTLLLVLIALVPLLISELIFSPSFTLRKFFDPNAPANVAFASYTVVSGLLLALVGFTSLVVVLTVGGLLALVAIVWLVVVLVIRVARGRQAAASAAKARLFSDNKLRAWPLFILLCGGSLIGVLTQPWVPLETIGRSDSGEPLVGYVVGEQNGFALIVDEAKAANWIATKSIADRTLCSRTPTDMWFRPIADLISPTLLPACVTLNE